MMSAYRVKRSPFCTKSKLPLGIFPPPPHLFCNSIRTQSSLTHDPSGKLPETGLGCRHYSNSRKKTFWMLSRTCSRESTWNTMALCPGASSAMPCFFYAESDSRYTPIIVLLNSSWRRDVEFIMEGSCAGMLLLLLMCCFDLLMALARAPQNTCGML